jgi:hypothetical protein
VFACLRRPERLAQALPGVSIDFSHRSYRHRFVRNLVRVPELTPVREETFRKNAETSARNPSLSPISCQTNVKN